MLSIGLMSGTSMDGIDVALLETDGTAYNIKELVNIFIPYSNDFKILLKSAEYAIRKNFGNILLAGNNYNELLNNYLVEELKININILDSKIMELCRYLRAKLTLENIIKHSTELHSQAVKKLLLKTNYKSSQITVIGYHGQTMYHKPDSKISIIIGDGKYLAEHLNITVVSNFRGQDVINGGFGAPFAPLYHQALAIRDNILPVAVVNCGGIANISLISNHNELDLLGFDTGPGNALIDSLIRKRTNGKENMDYNGKYGQQGKVNNTILRKLFAKAVIQNNNNYLELLPPKCLDYGDLQLIPELDLLSLEDACRTLEAFTAATIVDSLEFLTISVPTNWVLAGGGWKNPIIYDEFSNKLQQRLANIRIYKATEIGWNSQAMEAQIFAYFAILRLQNKPISFPNTTNVVKPMVGGEIYEQL